MEIIQEYSSQFIIYIPVALVIVGAILVFTFGFKSVEQPPFHKLTTEDKKSVIGKKKKLKEKKTSANGHVLVAVSKNDKSPKKSPSKDVTEQKLEKKEKKLDNKPKKPDLKVEEVKSKRISKKVAHEKPADFDDGDWETVPSKSDKKKKGEQSPAKKEKKHKKIEKVDKPEIEKLVKDIVIDEFKEEVTEKEVLDSPKVEEIVISFDEPAVIEDKKDKKKQDDKPKKDAVEKPVIPEAKQQVDPDVEVVKNEVSLPVAQEPTNQTSPSGAVFDELGDTWKEAKLPKKSQKKARRDN